MKRLLCLLLLLPLLTMGCREEGPAERAGRAIDDAAKEVGEGLEKAGEEIQEGVDR
jgi:hypothetical protein